MAKKQAMSGSVDDVLAELKEKKFDQVLPLEFEEDGQAGALVWGKLQGNETARILVMCVNDDHWHLVQPEYITQQSWKYAPSDLPEHAYAKFAMVSDGKDRRKLFYLEYPSHEIDQLPLITEMHEYRRLQADPTYRWSIKMYERLMNGFNNFHEQVYQTVKDRVSGKNDIILEVAKILFLEAFRLNHPNDCRFTLNNETLVLNKIFSADYVKKHGKTAVEEIQAAFDHFKDYPDYVVTDDVGQHHAIFDKQTHLQLAQPRNYETLLELIQDLGPVTNNRNQKIKDRGTMQDISADCLGRAFDVFLRANFDSKGGMGIYLTPSPVKQAILEIAFHDILKETPELLTTRDADGNPVFRFCDPACGTYGFGVVAMGYLGRTLAELLSPNTASDSMRQKLYKDMQKHSFIGADAAPMMVTLARVNMALLGATKARIFYTQNSLSTDQLKPNSFDLICTNPPFGTPKFKKGQENAKLQYEKDMERILELFCSDLKADTRKKDGFACIPTTLGLAMGGKPGGKGVWKTVKPASIDPAVLFLDRCLQLLKPGGRLLIVLPDGVLCNSGDRYVREYIMGKKDEATGQFHGGKAIVKAVISLPSDTFKLSGTGAKTSVLYLQKRKAVSSDDVRFVDEPQTDVFMAVADTLGYEVKNNVEDYSRGVPNDLAIIAGAYVRGE
ncbi:MAG: N-6 DNA methylase [Candidatus Ozemobacteraceae bacterium]